MCSDRRDPLTLPRLVQPPLLDSPVVDSSGAALCVFSGGGATFSALGGDRAIAVEFFPCKAKLGDGSVRDIERYTTVRLDVEFADIDPQELQSLEEKAVKNLVERIGESVYWGPNQEVSLLRFDNWKGEYVRTEDGEQIVAEIDEQESWASKQVTLSAELVDLKCHSKVGYVQSKMDAHMANDEWGAQEQVPEDVDEDLMKEVADHVNDADDNELVNLNDKEDNAIEVGKLWPSMDEFRMSFKTYAVKHEFEAKTMWTYRKKFYARCQGCIAI
ncbi:hypothetical protein QYE76_047717 [Lolium multiflorum]|uniref:Uncharacterized protein n=1 Tax=Lolium multiflorum TaxID=4521 RepID=A0AAD8X0F9_LOLMU|nr:hypothetical protein QYE76_047717 [Lolium multiflorum]